MKNVVGMETLPPFSDAIIVDGVEDEYARVRGEACECGARLVVRGQSFAEDEAGRHYDMLAAECGDCGASRRFLFHIGALEDAVAEAAPFIAAEPLPDDAPPLRGSAEAASGRDPRMARATLDLLALIACLFAVACVAFAWYVSTVVCVAVGAVCWFVPLGKTASDA